ncbi:MAG: PAS domain S-box protein [Candidatus Aminicenantes bacterium]|nr:PAS domain S-box protein [Candidatus Aminicenantes bacterium]
MKDQDKKKADLIKELEELRNRIKKIEKDSQNGGLFKSLVEQLPIGVYRTTKDGKIIYANPALASILGYKKVDDLLDISSVNVYESPPDREEQLQKWRSCKGVVHNELKFHTKKGRVIWVRDTGRVCLNKDGNIDYIDGAIQDITEIRKAEQILKESEERYRQSVENSPNPIFSVDKFGIVKTWNLACEQLFKYKAEEITGHLFHKLLEVPEERRRVEAKLAQVWQGYSVVSQDMTFKGKDGKRRYMVSRYYPLRDHEGKIVECVLANTDITERKQVEEALQRRATRLWLIERVGQRTTSILEVNQLLEEAVKLIKDTFNFYNVIIMLVEKDELVLKAAALETQKMKEGQITLKITGEEIPSRVASRGEAILVPDVSKEPRYVSSLDKIDTRSELAVPIKVKSEIIGVLDVQSSKRYAFSRSDLYTLQTLADQIAVAIENARLYEKANEEIKQRKKSEKKYRDLVDNTHVGVYQISMNGEILYVNRAVFNICGYNSLEEINKIGLKKIVKPVKDMNVLLDRFREEGKADNLELEVLTKKNDTKNVLVNAKLAGDILTGMVVDITDRKRAEEELKKAYEELQEAQRGLIQSEKLAALGTVASGIAHEIKNPLGIILGGIEYVERKLSRSEQTLDGDIRVAFQKIKESVFRADTIIHGFLRFARPSELKIEKMNVCDLIKDTLTLLGLRGPLRDIRLKHEFTEEDITIDADKNQIQQVLFNLLLNAVESMSDGGEVKIKARHSSKLNKAPTCEIDIIDNGPGISPDDLKRIFEPFYTTKGEKRGTGLGLPTAQMMIENHNGILSMDSELGKGTRVKILLPVSRP